MKHLYEIKSRLESSPSAETFFFLYSTNNHPEIDLLMALQRLNFRPPEVHWMDDIPSNSRPEYFGIVLGIDKQQLRSLQQYLVDQRGWNQPI
jgi:hypothetical protein